MAESHGESHSKSSNQMQVDEKICVVSADEQKDKRELLKFNFTNFTWQAT